MFMLTKVEVVFKEYNVKIAGLIKELPSMLT
jgi:hypothetical protein